MIKLLQDYQQLGDLMEPFLVQITLHSLMISTHQQIKAPQKGSQTVN